MMVVKTTGGNKHIASNDSWFGTLRRFVREKPVGAIGGLIFVLMIVIGILAPWISPYDPNAIDIAGRLASPSNAHWLGTDELGRDVLSRLLYGARISSFVGVAATVTGTTIGALIGVTSGFFGGRTDLIIQRFMDAIMTFPSLILAIAIMAALGPSVTNVIIAIAIPSVPPSNRVVRSIAMFVKEFQYIEAAKAVGAQPIRIIFKHILPNCMASTLIIATSMLGGVILAEASLSFLGLGVPAPTASWGRSLNEAMQYFYGSPLLAIFPGIAISIIVFSANMLGDALRDFWDPRLKRL